MFRNFDNDKTDPLIEFNDQGILLSPTSDATLSINFAVNQPLWHHLCFIWDYSNIK